MKPRFKIHWGKFKHMPDSCEYLGYDVDLEPLNRPAEDLICDTWDLYFKIIEG